MDLFNQSLNDNILSGESIAESYGIIFSREEITAIFNQLSEEIAWENDEILIFGKRITTKRKTAWYGDKPFAYTYSHTTKIALPWTQTLLKIKAKVELISNEKYNACLLNLYHDGNEGMGWHSDDEKMIVPKSAIASISFGATRKFVFKHKKDKTQVSVLLENGSLLVMKGETQFEWLHALPKSAKIKTPRINLTFRKIVE
jgi:alkylated DNA repair dioxygenase AlkB